MYAYSIGLVPEQMLADCTKFHCTAYNKIWKDLQFAKSSMFLNSLPLELRGIKSINRPTKTQ
jgi:hypothetical protein